MKNKLIPALVLLIAIALFSGSCSKSSTSNPNQAFIGSYIGMAMTVTNGQTNTTADTIIVTAGLNTSAILLTDNGSQISLGATVSGNTFTVPSQTINVNGTQLTLSGSGTLNGNTLTGSYSGTLTNGTTSVPITISYTETK